MRGVSEIKDYAQMRVSWYRGSGGGGSGSGGGNLLIFLARGGDGRRSNRICLVDRVLHVELRRCCG